MISSLIEFPDVTGFTQLGHAPSHVWKLIANQPIYLLTLPRSWNQAKLPTPATPATPSAIHPIGAEPRFSVITGASLTLADGLLPGVRVVEGLPLSDGVASEDSDSEGAALVESWVGCVVVAVGRSGAGAVVVGGGAGGFITREGTATVG